MTKTDQARARLGRIYLTVFGLVFGVVTFYLATPPAETWRVLGCAALALVFLYMARFASDCAVNRLLGFLSAWP